MAKSVVTEAVVIIVGGLLSYANTLATSQFFASIYYQISPGKDSNGRVSVVVSYINCPTLWSSKCRLEQWINTTEAVKEGFAILKVALSHPQPISRSPVMACTNIPPVPGRKV